jgi:hypothetical protein
MKPLFKPGQIVTVEGEVGRYLVPDRQYWASRYPKWSHIGYYARMTVDEFVAEKTRTQTADGCIDCLVDCLRERKRPCRQYLLVQLDGSDQNTDDIITHVCQKTMRLAE